MIQVGSTVGNFQIISVLGEGAMATVFLGEHPHIGKRVAIKVIHPELSTSQEMVSRFFTEARAVSQLRHDHLVEIQDYGQTPAGDNFIIMEYLEGRTLSHLLEPASRLPPPRAVAIALQIAEALGAAHERGVVHRDLKPDNIFLLNRGGTEDFVKVLDFGLAKLTGGPGAMQREHKTRTGSVLGTPHYMAPEQAEGKSTVDGRADIYSLGCILYRMLSGVLPFPGEGFGEVLVKHLREIPPPLRNLAPEVSPALDKVVRHAMAKRREYRFQSALELCQALREPERFSVHIGEDLRQIMGPNPGDPEAVPPRPPFGSTPAPPPLAGPAGLSVHGAGVAVASPEQRTIIAGIAGMMAPSLPGPQGGLLSEQQTVIGAAPAKPATGGNAPVAHNATLFIPDPTARPVMPMQQSAQGHHGTLIADLSAPGMAGGAGLRPGGPLPGQAPLPPPQPSRRGMVAAVLGGALLLGAGGGVLLPRLLKPKVYHVTVSSVPDKAQVLKDGALLGQTPLELQIRAGDPTLHLLLRKDGFVDAQRPLSAPAPPTLQVRLLAKPAPPPPDPADSGDSGDSGDKGADAAKPAAPAEKAATPVAPPPARPEAKPRSKPKADGAAQGKPKPKPRKKAGVVVPF